MAARRPTTPLPQLHVAMQTEKDFLECATRLKALADPDRLRIVNTLLRGAKSVSNLAEELGAPIDKISHHLGVLRSARLVETHKQGRFIIYSVPADVSIADNDADATKTIDLGCCQLDIVQPRLPGKAMPATKSRRAEPRAAKK